MPFWFENYCLDADRRELTCGSELIATGPKVFDLLLFLVENREQVVTRDDLLSAVWGGRIVSESTLTSHINAVRKAIGDTGKEQRLIRTVSRRGLRFVGKIEQRGIAGQHSGRGGRHIAREVHARFGVAGFTVDRGAAVPQSQRQRRAGLFRRRDRRGSHHGLVADSLAVRDRAQLKFHLQGRDGGREAGRA